MKRILIAMCIFAMPGPGLAQHASVDMRDRSIGEILNTTERVSIFDVLLDAAGLEETLSTGGPFTVFAPVDRAWVRLDGGSVDALLGDPEARNAVLLYHLVSGEVDSDELLALLIADARLRIGDENAAGMGVEDYDGDPVEALLATGVNSAVTFVTLQGALLEVTAGRPSDTVVHGGRQIGDDDPPLGNVTPVAALRAEGVDLTVGDGAFVSFDIVASNGVIHLIDRVLAPERRVLPK